MVTSTISRMGRSPEEGIKAPVKTVTDSNITLFGTGQTLSGVVTGTGDRVLVKDQTAPQFNGVYMVGPDAWERTTDMNAADDLENGQLIADSNTGNLYTINFTGAWSPDTTALTFAILLGSMPPSIVLTLANPIDLTDTLVALITGAADPDNDPHIEYDFANIQAKANATTAAVLFLNPLGGDVNIAADLVIGGLVDGVDVDAFSTAMGIHVSDGAIHFTQASISITATQVSDFASAVAANAAVAANTAKVSNVPTALSIGTQAIGTLGITSDGSADDVVLPSFTNTLAGLAPGSGGGTANFLRADGTWAAPAVVGTEQATTSGTVIDFTSIPAWATEISINFVGVSTNGVSRKIVQIGDAEGFEISGYLGSSSTISATTASSVLFTTGYGIGSGAAPHVLHGSITLRLENAANFTWVASGMLSTSNTNESYTVAGSKSLTAALDSVRITTVNGTDTFDAGAINIRYS